MALFHKHGHVDAVLTAVAWQRATIIEHRHQSYTAIFEATDDSVAATDTVIEANCTRTSGGR